MASNRTVRLTRENLKIELQPKKFLSYSDAVRRANAFSSLILRNEGDKDVLSLSLAVRADEGVVVEGERFVAEVPYRSSVEVVFDCLLASSYFIGLTEPTIVHFTLTVRQDKTSLCEERGESLALPFDWWSGLGGNAEELAGFVRPRLADCEKVLALAGEQLKKWKVPADINGYAQADKNAVRRIAAAVFMALRRAGLQKQSEADMTAPVFAGGGDFWKEKGGNPLSAGVFACSCLERAGLHPVLLVGERSVAVGVWLYDCCFLETVGDDMPFLANYCSEGIHNLSFFDVEDLFGDRNIGYPVAEEHFLQKIAAGAYEAAVDIRRCRLENICPLPLKERGMHGFELLDDEGTGENAPHELPLVRRMGGLGKQGKEKTWERRLLDLSLKNPLLNFNPKKNALQVVCADVDQTFASLAGSEKTVRSGSYRNLFEGGVPAFGTTAALRAKKEVVALENENGVLRVFNGEGLAEETLSALVRRGREAREESGTAVLYCAFGFLQWQDRENGKENFAPLVLQPVFVRRKKGNAGYTVVGVEEAEVNPTLLEFLKQEFGLDIRGLDGGTTECRPSEILAMVRLETTERKGWQVWDDVYISAFSFAKYRMWKDLRRNMDVFRQNPLVSSLLHNRNEWTENTADADGRTAALPSVLTPLPADGSQTEAIAASKAGKSFVLHGPPGTGKSQTITNIIANALADGKRVLFVAEKEAALSVVKKRLDKIGLGNFCLSVGDGKSEKADLVGKIEETLSLAGGVPSEAEEGDFKASGDNIARLCKSIADPLSALHKKRRAGVSVYEGMLFYLQNKNAPEILNIESSFYDGLTKEKLTEYENLLSAVSARAKECGGVYRSPFAGVELCEYSQSVRDGVYCACEVMLTEMKHLKNYLGLFLEFYRQRISTFTRRKAEILQQIISVLSSGELNGFFGEDEREFSVFYNANRRLDGALSSYFGAFRSLVDIRKEYRAISERLDREGESFYNSRELTAVVRKLRRVAVDRKMPETEAAKYLPVLVDIYAAMERIRTNTSLSAAFTQRSGFFDEKKRKACLQGLYRLHEQCGELFMDYNAEAFHSMCHRAVSGYTLPALEGLTLALQCFENAEKRFLSAIDARGDGVGTDDLFDYYTGKAGALIDNIDLLSDWCHYRSVAKSLQEKGLKFIVDGLENGQITGENVLSAFRKNVYRNFLEMQIPADPVLSDFSAAVLEDAVEQFRLAQDKYNEQSAKHIRDLLVSRLPLPDAEDGTATERIVLNRLLKGKLRGAGIGALFAEAPECMKRIAPCLIMSPLAVAQYLQPTVDFDLVIFDEASQMPTGEAIGALARAKSAVVVGDPKQLPPTAFFSSVYAEEDNPENEDMESVLDDCLAVGMPQKYLRWHYRSQHESLIAFSNAMYYGGKLCTFPSPDSLCSKVSYCGVDGVYERGGTKRNEKEAEALVAEVVRRLKDPVLRRSSLGVITFSQVQKEYIERRLSRAIAQNGLEEYAYEREEEVFVKNLENVQGDERDVILFSVCYGPDRMGKISLNFGPLNQAGGWRRLNVAVSRAREEMLVFASMTSAQIDLSRTTAKGVAGLKAFLEFAQKGRTSLAVGMAQTVRKEGIGKFVAEELTACGYECRTNVGASDFRIDVAVVDPHDRSRFLLAVLIDSTTAFTVQDRNLLQPYILKKNNWNVLRLYSAYFYNNPKREIKKIKEYLDRLLGVGTKGSALTRSARAYRTAKLEKRAETTAFVADGNNAEEILKRLRAVVQAEEPISASFLKKRVLHSLGIVKYGKRTESVLDGLIAECKFREEVLLGQTYYRRTDRYVDCRKYRTEQGEAVRKSEADLACQDLLAYIRAALEDKVALYIDELAEMSAQAFRLGRPSEKFVAYLAQCIGWGEREGLFLRSVSDRISLA